MADIGWAGPISSLTLAGLGLISWPTLAWLGLISCCCRQHWVLPQHQPAPSFLNLNPQQLRRRSLYSGAQSVTSMNAPNMRKPPVVPSEVQAWVQRELQAVTLEDDVKIVSQVVLRAMTLLQQSLSSQGTRYFKYRVLSALCQKRQLAPVSPMSLSCPYVLLLYSSCHQQMIRRACVS